MRTQLLNFLILCSAFAMNGCQKEEYEVLTEQNSVEEDAEFQNLVYRSAMYDGSTDDELDGSSCFSIDFPYQVKFNGLVFNVRGNEELEVLLEQYADLGLGSEFTFAFPLEVTLSNYQEQTVNTQSEFENLRQRCSRDQGLLDPITCVALSYPIRTFIYNTDTQTTHSVDIAHKQQLFLLLKNKTAAELLSFEYPIEASLNNTRTEIRSNVEFKKLLSNCSA